MKVHIQGMGIVGSMLAWSFKSVGIKFTWNDSEEDICAWKASTGCIYPSGDPKEYQAYKIWQSWLSLPTWTLDVNQRCIEKTAFWFATKNPPHGGKYEIKRSVGPLQYGMSSFQLNSQKFVKLTRSEFEEFRTDKPTKSLIQIISHGFHEKTLDHYQWGWSATAKLNVSSKITNFTTTRPCFYLRRGRVTPLVYAYPKPGTDKYYAGSYMLNTKTTKSYEIKPKMEKWAEQIEKLTDGLVRVVSVTKPKEGWRPCGKEGMKMVFQKEGHIFVRPQEGSGVRMAPIYTKKVLELLQ